MQIDFANAIKELIEWNTPRLFSIFQN